MKISFCTQIKNRFHQFEQVFFDNLQNINMSKYNIEWIIVDMNSDDGLNNFIKPYISQNISYYRPLEDIKYSIPIAKNFASRLSSGDYVFNLDADNYINNIDKDIVNHNYIPIYCNKFLVGVFGRIGCKKDLFKAVGGYDESFYPAGYHENDFFNRCKLLGHNFKHIECDRLPLQNTKEETTKNTNLMLSWQAMQNLNKAKGKFNQQNKIINPNLSFTECTFICNFNNTIQLGKNFDNRI